MNIETKPEGGPQVTIPLRLSTILQSAQLVILLCGGLFALWSIPSQTVDPLRETIEKTNDRITETNSAVADVREKAIEIRAEQRVLTSRQETFSARQETFEKRLSNVETNLQNLSRDYAADNPGRPE